MRIVHVWPLTVIVVFTCFALQSCGYEISLDKNLTTEDDIDNNEAVTEISMDIVTEAVTFAEMSEAESEANVGDVIFDASVPKAYTVSYNATLLENDSVGEEWIYGVKFETAQIFSGTTITIENDVVLNLQLFVCEYDKRGTDYGASTVTFSELKVGETEVKVENVCVRENDGRYEGNLAKWVFTITCKRIS